MRDVRLLTICFLLLSGTAFASRLIVVGENNGGITLMRNQSDAPVEPGLARTLEDGNPRTLEDGNPRTLEENP